MTNESLARAKAFMAGKKIEETTEGDYASPVPGFFDMVEAGGPASFMGGSLTVAISHLHDFAEHTFKVNEDSPDYKSLMESIRANGIREPLLVRPHPTIAGDYEIIAGHRRKKIAETIGLESVPCHVEMVNDYEATILMGETNIQRPDWLPSEKARTYKIHLDALKKETGIKAGRPVGTEENNCGNSCHNYKLRDIAAQRWGVSPKSFDMYIKLNDLLADLLDLTDEGRIATVAAYQLSFLSDDQQWLVLRFMQSNLVKIAGGKGKEIREAGEVGDLDEAYLLRIFHIEQPQEKAVAKINIAFSSDVLLNKRTVKAALNNAATLEQIEALIVDYAKKNSLPLN